MLENIGIGITSDFHDGTILEEGYGLHCHKIIATDPEISATTLGVYYYLNSYLYGGKLEAFPTQFIMAFHLKIDLKTLRKHLQLLQKNGYLVIEKIPAKSPGKDGKQNHFQNLYHIVSRLDDIFDIKERGTLGIEDYLNALNEKKRKREARMNIKRRAIKGVNF